MYNTKTLKAVNRYFGTRKENRITMDELKKMDFETVKQASKMATR